MRTSPKITASLATVLFSSVGALHIAITGTSQGIGLDAAKRLIRHGHTVYHANRNSARSAEAAEAAGGGIPMVCDLASLASVRAFADELSTKPLDVLCLNAGIAPSTKAEAPEATADGFESCIGTNHLGHFLLANLLAPKVSRIVVTASSVHDPDQPGGAVGGKGGATLGDLSGLGPLTIGGPTMVDGATAYDGSMAARKSDLASTSPPSTHWSTFTQVQGLQRLQTLQRFILPRGEEAPAKCGRAVAQSRLHPDLGPLPSTTRGQLARRDGLRFFCRASGLRGADRRRRRAFGLRGDVRRGAARRLPFRRDGLR